MAYQPQTVPDFRTRYPEFTVGAVDDHVVFSVLAEAELETDITWREVDRGPAVLALTAHWLAGQGVLNAGPFVGGVQASGLLKARTVGDVRMEFADARSGSSSSSGSSFAATIYGRRWLELKNRNVPSTTYLVRA